ncbi:hypothetical protein PM082_024532 [Marasmius tenuissimus]|nr:hypothetical protein PM082_024532 [Marasmius tenuissimus]
MGHRSLRIQVYDTNSGPTSNCLNGCVGSRTISTSEREEHHRHPVVERGCRMHGARDVVRDQLDLAFL